MDLGRRLPVLRWSVLRMALGFRNFTAKGQIGDGRESAAADYVIEHARRGDPTDALAKLDEFSYRKSFLVSIGDEKGRLLDAAVRRAGPRLAVELGTYCGYGALRIAVAAPAATVVSVELSPANAAVAQRIWEHAGVADMVSCVVGSIGDGGRTLDLLQAGHGCADGAVDLIFIDHDKSAYLTDLQSILGRGWLHPGSIVLADNIRIPGAPNYRRYMREQQNRLWRTREHPTHVEYQTLLPDLVLESEYLGPAG